MAMTDARARGLLVGAALETVAGVAVAGTFDRVVGGVMIVAGWLAFVYALHAYGRASE